LEDMAPLLVPHSAMKSYPMSYLEKSRFDRLTQWLDGFTTHDLSALDAGQCDSIDDWLRLLDAKTEVRVLHSTGTSGKLSFLPRGTKEMKLMVTGYRRQFDAFHDEPSIGGRLRVAEAKGELGKIQISPKLMERRDAFLKDQARQSEYLDAFFAEVSRRFRAKTVSVMGHIPMLHNIALEARKRGVENLFAGDSFVAAGGGMKGHNLPDDWRETIDRFLGGAPLIEGYGMTEVVAASRICGGGHYHLPTWHVAFVLNPETGHPLPRTGTVKGRYGVFDLNAQTYWGGFLTGDEVTLSWGDEASCGCGRIGPYLHRGIRRFTEQEGGDDKITCAGAPEAHDKAIDFLLQSIG